MCIVSVCVVNVLFVGWNRLVCYWCWFVWSWLVIWVCRCVCLVSCWWRWFLLLCICYWFGKWRLVCWIVVLFGVLDLGMVCLVWLLLCLFFFLGLVWFCVLFCCCWWGLFGRFFCWFCWGWLSCLLYYGMGYRMLRCIWLSRLWCVCWYDCWYLVCGGWCWCGCLLCLMEIWCLC